MHANAPLLADETEENDLFAKPADTSSAIVDADTECEAKDNSQEQGLLTNVDDSALERNGQRCRCSPSIKICASHALSAWGDRMWMFAISVFLIALTPGSFLFTAIYGLSVSLSVVAFGTLVGDWIDRTPRLKAVRLTLIIQNIAVVGCAVVVLIMFHQSISDAIFLILAIVLVLLAIVARLSSLGTTISIERDWVVVIAQEDEFLLAGTNAILRRIDLTCNILAPVSTGLILDYGSTLIGVLFIAGWNVASVFVEYFMLSSVYQSCPALANKKVDVNRLKGSGDDSEGDDNGLKDVSLDSCPDSTVLVPRVKTTSRCSKLSCSLMYAKVKSRLRILRYGLKLFFRQRVAFAGIGLSCLYMTVLGFDSITTAYAYSQHVSAGVLGALTAAGALTGILGTFIFPKLRQLFGLVKTGMISNSIQLFFLMFCVASVWAPGHPGHLLDPNYHDDVHGKAAARGPARFSVQPTKIVTTASSALLSNISGKHTFAISVQPTLTSHPISSIFAPPRPKIISKFTSSESVRPSKTRSVTSSYSSVVNTSTATAGNNTKNNSGSNDNADHRSFLSLGFLMGGIVMSRIGLWMTDLVITQLFQENVLEQERGIVSGVQNSFNSIMDVLHFVMVTVAPRPEQFGILILISVTMVSIGFAFYSCFAWNHRRLLTQLEKLGHWSTSIESMEGASRRLRDESRHNSETDISSGSLTVRNDNYELNS